MKSHSNKSVLIFNQFILIFYDSLTIATKAPIPLTLI